MGLSVPVWQAVCTPNLEKTNKERLMENWMIVGLIISVVVVLAGVAWVMSERNRSKHLQERFGPEYNWAVTEAGNRRHAEAELARREARARHIRKQRLTPSDPERFLSQW